MKSCTFGASAGTSFQVKCVPGKSPSWKCCQYSMLLMARKVEPTTLRGSLRAVKAERRKQKAEMETNSLRSEQKDRGLHFCLLLSAFCFYTFCVSPIAFIMAG